jgi:CheY-like chemotaxis protein
MTPQEMQRLFKRFSQASSRTHIEYGGCGIGLYICRQLAEKQGGQVGVASLKGEGAAFGFYIETRRADALNGLTAETARLSIDSVDLRLPERAEVSELAVLSKVIDDEEQSKKPPPLPRTESQWEKQPGKYHVLLCEDNLINQRILAKQLRASGCIVTVANHGREALDVLQQTDWICPEPDIKVSAVDVVLLDWEMPIMNGLQACRRIRELESSGQANRRLPVVAITANVRQAQIEQAMAAGMDSVLPKPFTVTELLERIEQLTKGVAASR